MTIREMEERTGLPRASIRFYEREGLLSPSRSGNGYRDYSEAELLTLERVKLLRGAGVTLEQLRAVQDGTLSLAEALSQALSALEGQQKANERARSLCRAMLSDGADFATLDVARYSGEKAAEGSVWDWISEEEPPVFGHPWRRLLARCLDIGFYTLLWAWGMALLHRISITVQPLLVDCLMAGAVLVMMLFLEPLWLRLWGTTPGKWLLGLRVEDVEGGRPRYCQGLERTWAVLGDGLGYGVPVWSLVCLYRSWQRCEEGTLSWETEAETELVLAHPRRRWGLFALGVAVHAALLCGSILYASWEQLPPHRGDLSIQQFVENYNYYCDYFGWEGEYLCLENGELRLADSETKRSSAQFDFSWREENGVVTGIYFLGVDTCSTLGITDGVTHYAKEILCTLSFAGAQKGVSLLRGDRAAAADEIFDRALFCYEWELGGAHIQKNFEYEHFDLVKRKSDGRYFFQRESGDPLGYWRVDFAVWLP